MDFEPRFNECCKACNSLSQNLHQAIGIQGQGDCESSVKNTEDQNIWKRTEAGKKLKTKVKEKDRSGSKVEKQKKLESVQCDCLKKSTKKDISDKIQQNTKEEKKSNDVFENCRASWKFPHIKWNNDNMDELYVSNEFGKNDQSSRKMLAETVSKLKEKVDFLFRVFNNSEEKLLSTDIDVQTESKALGAVLKDAWDFWNLNKRLCIAEDGIEKLALILEDLLNESNKKAFSADETVVYNDSLNFEELPIAQRINLLKSRNDMLLGFMKGFLKVGSVEEIRSQFTVSPEDYELKHSPLSSTFRQSERSKLNNCNKEKVMETLRNLRMQLTKEPEMQLQDSIKHKAVKNFKKEENPLKYSGKKLEVISEQAELAFDNDNKSENLDNFITQNNENLKGKLSEVCEDLEETDLSLRDVTTRLFAQEAMLKSSLDKVHLELLSKQDAPEKNCLKANWDLINSSTRTDHPAKEKDTKRHKEVTFQHSAREVNCIYCETGIDEKCKFNDAIFYKMNDDYKEPVKEGKKYLENTSDTMSKQNTSDKKTEELEEAKNKSNRRLKHKNSYTVLIASKANRNNCFLSEGCSSSREESKTELKAREPRPMTAPNFPSKTVLSSSLKSLTLEKSNKKNLGIKNVKNKNKILLSKKSFVQTS